MYDPIDDKVPVAVGFFTLRKKEDDNQFTNTIDWVMKDNKKELTYIVSSFLFEYELI